MGTIGYDVTESFFVEAGYRYLAVDYTNDAFVYDIAEAGVFMGFGFRF